MQEMQERQVRSLDREDPLEKKMATHSSILAWKIPWTEKSGRLQFRGSEKSDTRGLLWSHRGKRTLSDPPENVSSPERPLRSSGTVEI